MISEILRNLSNNDFHKALELINKALSKSFNFTNPDDEKEYLKLLELRIIVKNNLGIVDEIIQEAVRKNKYPYERNFLIDNIHKICLRQGSAFLYKSDAYVHTIHSVNLFEGASDRSATSDFVKNLGMDNIKSQIGNASLRKGDFVVLSHSNLNAPISYHILFYNGIEKDYEALSKGLRSVLDDAMKRNLKRINFFPLGFNIVANTEEKDRNIVAKEITDKIVETIVSYIRENKRKYIPELEFDFTSYDTMRTFDYAFEKWINLEPNFLLYMQQLSIKEKAIIEQARTKNDDYMKALKDLCAYIDGKKSILILGETGVGKSHLAKITHYNSNRASNKFRQINCATLRPQTIHTQLFGWKKGSYTDAKDDGVGAIEDAEGGTLFLDEIGYTDIETQRMLLKFLDDGIYNRFGDREERKANVRMIFGTNVDIQQLSIEKRFAPDLFERISQIVIEIPPLRNRPEDIERLIDFFINELNITNNFNLKVAPEAKKELKKYLWPGNIRQLESYISKLYSKVTYNKFNTLDCKTILSDPPRNYSYENNQTFLNLEKHLKEFLSVWKPEDGKFIENFIQPIIAKLYKDDLKGNIKASGPITGMDGTGGTSGKLQTKYREYKLTRDKFSK